MGLDDSCNTRLVLGLGLASTTLETPQKTEEAPPVVKPRTFEPPSLTLSLSGKSYLNESCHNSGNRPSEDPATVATAGGGGDQLYRQGSPLHSAVSSFSSGRVKRERDLSGEEIEVEKGNSSSRLSDEDDDGVNNTRKKLRLTKEQSALLEESFKQQSTLNPKQKQALAGELNLRARQVEVWFQNRRARTKLKQTEVDCELLKKCCETLTDENRRLQKELQELKALNLPQPPFYMMRMPPATITVCPSCERVTGAGGGPGDVNTTKSLFSLAPKSHHLFSPFSNRSAAC